MGDMEGSVERGGPEGKGGSGWWGAEKEQMQGRRGGGRRRRGEEVKEVWVNMVVQIKCSQPWPQLRPTPKKKMLSTKIKPRSFSLAPQNYSSHESQPGAH